MGKHISIISLILVSCLVLFLLIYRPFVIVNVKGISMLPSYEEHSVLMMTKRTPKQFDVVHFLPNWDNTENVHMIKRVIAKPNDFLEIKNNTIYVNQKEYLDFSVVYQTEKTFEGTIDGYFVMGDNLGVSHDSLQRFIKGFDFLVKTKIEYSYTDERSLLLLNE